jgi:phosphoserine phosphatase
MRSLLKRGTSAAWVAHTTWNSPLPSTSSSTSSSSSSMRRWWSSHPLGRTLTLQTDNAAAVGTFKSTTKRWASSSSSVSGAEILEQFLTHRPKTTLVGNNVALAMESLAAADCVCFDVDSTVVTEEGIDVLAAHLGKGEQVAALTASAMGGTIKFQDALSARLDLLQPSRAQILDCLDQHALVLTPGVESLVQALRAANKAVHLVSGGFRIMIEPIAVQLKLDPQTHVTANQILFDEQGHYAGFDATEPTSQDMGKPRALQQLQKQFGYQTMVMIGDGATDAQAKPPARAFVGFGGVVVREKVVQASDWFVTDFDDLTYIVQTVGLQK